MVIHEFIIIGIIRVDYKSIVAKKIILIMSMNVKTIMFLITAGIASLIFGFDMYYKGFDLPQTSLTIIQ
jgi:hypothetical protein